MINKNTNYLILLFWGSITISLISAKESFELFQWITLVLISAIGLMLTILWIYKIKIQEKN